MIAMLLSTTLFVVTIVAALSVIGVTLLGALPRLNEIVTTTRRVPQRPAQFVALRVAR